jgi:hypothetical protein
VAVQRDRRAQARREAGSLGDSVIALHDRRVPKSRANIDHIVIGSAGVYVIDAKRYRNAKIAVRRSGGFLSPVRTQLMVSGRDRTKLVEAMDWQVTAVRAALSNSAEFADVPITAALCFIDAEFPLFGTIEINEVRGLGGTGQARHDRGRSRRPGEGSARQSPRRPAAHEAFKRFCSALVNLGNTERDSSPASRTSSNGFS